VVAGVGCAFILVCFFLPDAATRSLRKETMELLGPALRTVQAPVDFFSNLNAKLKTLDEAQKEAAKLREEVAQLKIHDQLLEHDAAENARLREMLGFQAASQYELLPCRVISREPSSWWDSVQVNVGWDNNQDLDEKYHGKYSLGPDQPVVSPRGVVGKTGNVSRYVTDVILMVNQNCSISATVDGTHDQGIVQGQGNFEDAKPRVLVSYLPKDSQITVGQFIVTSGLGPYFPAGLRLGTVVEVPPVKNEYPTFGLYREAVLEPTADLNQLDELFVVLGPKQQKANGDENKPDAGSSPDSGSSSDNGSSQDSSSNPPNGSSTDAGSGGENR
jgi:rod shape-determining protein MreC